MQIAVERMITESLESDNTATGDPCIVNPGIANQHTSMSTACSGSNSHGQVCTLVCQVGYTKSSDLTCTAGSWDTPLCDGMAADGWQDGQGSEGCEGMVLPGLV